MNRLVIPQLTEFGPQHSEELTAFDRSLFVGFHEVDESFYPGIFRDGARVAGHQDEEGAIVSVATLYPQSLSDPDVPMLEQQIPPEAGFLDGAAVDPLYRKSRRPDLDLHGELLDWRINTARDLGKTVALSVVRADNYPSYRNLRGKGFYALADAQRYYGSRPEDDRIAGAILLDAVETVAWSEPPNPTSLAELENVLTDQPDAVTLYTPRGIDSQYRQAVSRLLQNGYMNYGYSRGSAADTITFIHLETSGILPDNIKSRLLTIRRVLQQLCDQ